MSLALIPSLNVHSPVASPLDHRPSSHLACCQLVLQPFALWSHWWRCSCVFHHAISFPSPVTWRQCHRIRKDWWCCFPAVACARWRLFDRLRKECRWSLSAWPSDTWRLSDRVREKWRWGFSAVTNSLVEPHHWIAPTLASRLRRFPSPSGLLHLRAPCMERCLYCRIWRRLGIVALLLLALPTTSRFRAKFNTSLSGRLPPGDATKNSAPMLFFAKLVEKPPNWPRKSWSDEKCPLGVTFEIAREIPVVMLRSNKNIPDGIRTF